MKIFLLRPRESFTRLKISGDFSPWEPWYDRAFGFVVRAENEYEARKIASANAGDEGIGCWIYPRFSTCIELLPEGEPGMIIRDFATA